MSKRVDKNKGLPKYNIFAASAVIIYVIVVLCFFNNMTVRTWALIALSAVEILLCLLNLSVKRRKGRGAEATDYVLILGGVFAIVYMVYLL